MEIKVTEHPAQEQTGYGLGAPDGDAVAITKSYELVSQEAVEDEPRLRITGGGELRFDAKAGIPLSLEYKAKLVETSEFITIRVPIAVSCRLLAGAERDKAMIPPAFGPTALNPIAEADVSAALADLRSADNGVRHRALERLRDAAPIDARRAEVARAIEPIVEGQDASARSMAIQALGVWGDERSAAPLVAHLNDDRFGARPELFEALGRLAPTDATATAMVGWLAKDPNSTSRVLRAMGPAAEPALIAAIQADGPAPPRIEACRLLKDDGTARCVPALTAAARGRSLEELGRIAEGALRQINERHLTDVTLAEIALDLDSPDNNRRNRALQRLEAARPVAEGREPIARAVERVLDAGDRNTANTAARVLASWGDAASAEFLAAHLKIPGFEAWREVATALVRLSKDEATATALAARINDDRGYVFRTFRELGPPAEPATLAILASSKDGGVRAEACDLLREIGTARSLTALRAAAADRSDPNVAGVAAAALKAISGRKLDDATLGVTLTALRSADAGHRRDALERLAAARAR